MTQRKSLASLALAAGLFVAASACGTTPDAGLITCGETGVTYSTEEAFPTTPNCARFRGSLQFERSSTVTSLRFLSSVEVIDGFVAFREAASLSTFEGMERVRRIGGSLTLYRVPSFSLEGLNSLTEVGGDLRIEEGSLTVLEGLSSLETIGGDLRITNALRLFSIADLRSLRRVEGDVYIYFNYELPESEVDALLARIEVGGTVFRSPP